MKRTIALASAAVLGLLLLSGCGEEPKPVETKKEEKKKPAVPEGNITGLTAYYEVYAAARKLAPDMQTASIEGVDVDGVKSEEGKYSQWKVVLVSASQQQAWTFIYSTVEKAPITRGINPQGNVKWAGARRDAMPFANGDFSVDSDAAYKAAAEKAKGYLSGNAKPISTFALGNASNFPAPMWYIQWGSKTGGGYAAFVNAQTGTVK